MAQSIGGRKVAILATHGFELAELTEPQKSLRNAGAIVHGVSPEQGTIRGYKHLDPADQITVDAVGVTTATFDTFPVELPGPLDRLVRTHLTRRGQASYVSRPDTWLFPGGIPGKHLATENVRSQLVARGIQPLTARNAAMFQLAASMPTPILAEVLGLAPNTATRWAALASRDWSAYTAQRDTHLRR